MCKFDDLVDNCYNSGLIKMGYGLENGDGRGNGWGFFQPSTSVLSYVRGFGLRD